MRKDTDSWSPSDTSPAGGGATRVALGIMSSRIVGLIREASLGFFFGAGPHADVFRTALRGPNILQNLLGEYVDSPPVSRAAHCKWNLGFHANDQILRDDLSRDGNPLAIDSNQVEDERLDRKPVLKADHAVLALDSSNLTAMVEGGKRGRARRNR